MKIKSAHETAGLGNGHRYLGHFAKPKYINAGHNTDPMGMDAKNKYKDATGVSIDATEQKAPARGPEGYQGVTTGPKGPPSARAEFEAEQARKGKDAVTVKRMADQIYGK